MPKNTKTIYLLKIMKNAMPRKITNPDNEYATIKVKKEVATLMDNIIKYGKKNYVSRADLVRDLVRDFYDKLKKEGIEFPN
jgi:hypothetical protein